MNKFQNNQKIKMIPLPYIGLFDLDVLYQTSDIELLYQILYKVNEITQSQNIIIDNFQKVLDWANEQIELYTKEEINNMYINGKLEKIVSQYFTNEFLQLDNKITQNKDDITNTNDRINNIVIGGTVSDVEVIDARNGNGITYGTLHDSIVKQIEYNDMVRHEFFINDNFKQGSINNNGSIIDSEYNLVSKDYFIPNPLTTYIFNPIKNIQVYEYDNNNNFIRMYSLSTKYSLTYLKENPKKYLFVILNFVNIDLSKLEVYHYKFNNDNVSPKLFGYDGLNTTNVQPYFYLMFEYCNLNTTTVDIEGNNLYDYSIYKFNFSGNYYSQTPIDLGNIINAHFENLHITGINNMSYLLNANYLRNTYFTNCIFDCKLLSSCLNISLSYSNLVFNNCIIKGFSLYGINLHNGHEFLMNNCKMYQVDYQDFTQEFIDRQINGTCIFFNRAATDSNLSNNIFCYTAGNLISVYGASTFFTNNHFYNNGNKVIDIYEANVFFNNNYFDTIKLYDRRGGNMYVGNSFINANDYLIEINTEYFYSRKSVFTSNIFITNLQNYIKGDLSYLILNDNYIKNT